MKQNASMEEHPGRMRFKCLNFRVMVGSYPHSGNSLFSRKISPLFLFSLLLLACLDLKGQMPGVLFDTIHFERENNSRFDYVVSNSTIQTIGYEDSSFKRCKGDHFSVAGETGREMLTLLTGLGTEATRDVNWIMSGRINTDDQKLNWKVDLYCPGTIFKAKERVRNEDGSVSTENFKEVEVYWEEAVGFIIHESDTIGSFVLLNEPRWASNWTKRPPQLDDTALPSQQAVMLSPLEFALQGDLYGQEFQVIYNSSNNLIYLYHETELRGIFQPDRKKQSVRKKKIVKPYLLVEKNLSEAIQSDVLLLSMLSQWLMVSFHEPN